MSEQINEIGITFQLEDMQRKLDKILDIKPLLEEITKGTDDLQREITNEITKFALAIRSSKLDKSELKDWFANCYYLYKDKSDQNKENSWHLAIPSFIDASFGYLERKIPGWHVFQVNPYAHWLGDIPVGLKEKMGLKDPLDVYLDGDRLVGKDIQKIKMKMASFIKKEEKDYFVIDKSQHFQLLASLIKEGILPFLPKPVDKEEFQTENRFTEEWELRDYHLEAWNTFLKYSNIGYYLPPSGGKTFLGIYALGKLKGPHLVCVPSRELREQWIARIETYTNLTVSDNPDQGSEVVVMTYQSAILHAHKYKWNLVIVDEHHHLPANLFSKMATIERKHMMGLSATPMREDNREEFIFALTGKPCGLSWQKVKELGIIQNPDLNVWLVKDDKERMQQLATLLSSPGQAIVFSDSIKLGQDAADKNNLRFVHGTSKTRVKDIGENESFVCSRVGDEGISLPKIKRVIEIDWLHGSRRQELQRFTRILHGKNKDGVGHIIMTLEQFHTDRKRLFGVMEKGFKIILHREGFTDKQIVHNPNETKTKIKKKGSIIGTNELKANGLKDKLIEQVAALNPLLQGMGRKPLLKNLNTNELECLKIFFANPHIKYTKERIWNVLRKGRIRDFASFQKMETLGFIEKVGNAEYQAKLK